MKVNDSTAQDNLKQLDLRLRNQTLAKEAEIEKIKELFDKKIETAKAVGEENYVTALKKNDDQILMASKDYEDKLNNYRNNLTSTQKNIETEEKILKHNQDDKFVNLKSQSENNIHDLYQNSLNNQEDLQSQAQNSNRMIADKLRSQKLHLESKSMADINAKAQEFNQKELEEERNYQNQLTNNIRNHDQDLTEQKTELQKNTDSSIEKNKRLQNEKIRVQNEELVYLDKHQKDMIQQKQEDFKVRYQNMVNEHQTLLDELKTHLDTDVKKMVSQSADQKKNITNRLDDRFYQIGLLSPNLSENEKEFQVSLKVPEHEKENVHLSAHGRGVKLTQTRKFSDSLESEDGTINRSSRSELLSREFPSKDILNPKMITQNYSDGTLTFKIQKL